MQLLAHSFLEASGKEARICPEAIYAFICNAPFKGQGKMNISTNETHLSPGKREAMSKLQAAF